MKKLALALLALSACAPTVVTEFNGDSVTVQSQYAKVMPDVTAEAARICATKGLRAEYASTREVYAPQYASGAYAHLFLCLDGSRGGFVSRGAATPTSRNLAPSSFSPAMTGSYLDSASSL